MRADVHLRTPRGVRRPLRVVDPPIAVGGAGRIHRIEGDELLLAKLYHEPARPPRRREKLEAMLAAPPELPAVTVGGATFVQIAWPVGVLEDGGGALLGFAMPSINVDAAVALEGLLTRRSRKALGLPESYGYRLTAARNLAAMVAELHARGHHVVDLKPINVNVYRKTFLVAMLDCDGFSVAGPGGERFPAHQYTDGYIAPEALRARLPPQELGETQDRFALAVVLFQLLNMGIHPYQGRPSRSRTASSTDHERVEAGLYAYGRDPHPELSPSPWSLHEFLEDETRALFDRAFGAGRDRPSARDWRDHLQPFLDPGSSGLRTCQRDREHLHFSKGCGLCSVEPRSSRAGRSRAARPAPVVASPPRAPASTSRAPTPGGRPPAGSSAVATPRARSLAPHAMAVGILLLMPVAGFYWQKLTGDPAPAAAERTVLGLPKAIRGIPRADAMSHLDDLLVRKQISRSTHGMMVDLLRTQPAPDVPESVTRLEQSDPAGAAREARRYLERFPGTPARSRLIEIAAMADLAQAEDWKTLLEVGGRDPLVLRALARVQPEAVARRLSLPGIGAAGVEVEATRRMIAGVVALAVVPSPGVPRDAEADRMEALLKDVASPGDAGALRKRVLDALEPLAASPAAHHRAMAIRVGASVMEPEAREPGADGLVEAGEDVARVLRLRWGGAPVPLSHEDRRTALAQAPVAEWLLNRDAVSRELGPRARLAFKARVRPYAVALASEGDGGRTVLPYQVELVPQGRSDDVAAEVGALLAAHVSVAFVRSHGVPHACRIVAQLPEVPSAVSERTEPATCPRGP